MLKLHLH